MTEGPCTACLGTKLRRVASPDEREVYFGPGPCPECAEPDHASSEAAGDYRRTAFIVIVETHPTFEHPPVIGDVLWALKDGPGKAPYGWHDLHVTNLTTEMLEHHGLPYPTEVTNNDD